ncbi:MAG TPA: neutral zinc metallopeptidase, partial [Erysipelothrix sp.]
MKWEGRRQSGNVQDRRGKGGGAAVGGLGLVAVLIFTLLTGDPRALINLGLNASANINTEYVETPKEKELAEFVSVVLADTEDVWHAVFEKNQMNYQEPELILFKQSVRSGCGVASSDVGPFYCPADQSIYIDLGFHQELKNQFEVEGDFAMAYVVAHEVGHHVQNLLGISDQVHKLRGELSEKEYNRILKRLELQADYLAGVWAHYQENNNLLEVEDIPTAMQAASAIGDDRIQE